MKVAELFSGLKPDFGRGQGIDVRKLSFVTKTTVSAGRQPHIELPLIGVRMKQQQSTGDTSKTEVPMPKYKTKPHMDPR